MAPIWGTELRVRVVVDCAGTKAPWIRNRCFAVMSVGRILSGRAAKLARYCEVEALGSLMRAMYGMGAVLVVAALLASLLLALLWVFQRSLIYLPDSRRVGPPGAALPSARQVTLKTSDGLELGGWFAPATNSDSGMTVLVPNGNAGNRSMRAPLATALNRAGFSVLLFDYRGFGGNPGTPSEEGLVRDARAAQQLLVEGFGLPADRLMYYGESLGAAVVTRLAASHSPAGLVLRSPFVDLASVAAFHYPFLPVRALLKDQYPVADILARVRVPTVVIYGTKDSIVPPEQSRAVAEAAGGPTRTVAVQGADHNDPVLLNGSQLVDSVVALGAKARGRASNE
jgi:fermentation-respiration switch protein FrsA (DUF1100 family)